MTYVYIAGPLFTEGERRILEDIDKFFQQVNFRTYLPHRDAGLFTREGDSSRRFFNNDLEKLQEADFIIAVLNGVDVDSGTSWEIGYAFAHKKPVIGYVKDTRVYDPKTQFNPMIWNSLAHLVNNLEELKEILLTKRNETNDRKIK